MQLLSLFLVITRAMRWELRETVGKWIDIRFSQAPRKSFLIFFSSSLAFHFESTQLLCLVYIEIGKANERFISVRILHFIFEDFFRREKREIFRDVELSHIRSKMIHTLQSLQVSRELINSRCGRRWTGFQATSSRRMWKLTKIYMA